MQKDAHFERPVKAVGDKTLRSSSSGSQKIEVAAILANLSLRSEAAVVGHVGHPMPSLSLSAGMQLIVPIGTLPIDLLIVPLTLQS